MKKFLTMGVGNLLPGLITPPPLRWRKTLAMRYKA